MKQRKGRMTAGLLAGLLALSGCSALEAPAATPTPEAAQKATAQPTADAPKEETAQKTLTLMIEGEEIKTPAMEEADMVLLPLIETAQVLGWAAEEEAREEVGDAEETQTKRSVVLSKGESRISVAWTVSDNTARKITWQKDGLLIPVNTKITTLNGVVYVPAAFFEEAMGVKVSRTMEGIDVLLPEEKATPKTQEQTGQSSDE